MRRIRIRYHHEPDGWWADSPDVEGFTAGGATLPEARRQVLEGLAFYLGEEVLIEEQDTPLPATPDA